MDSILKLLFGSIYFFLLLGCCAYLYSQHEIKKLIKNNWKTLLAFLLINILVLNVALYFHMSQESFIPSWDFGGFYRKTLEFMDKLDRSVPEAAINLFDSINTLEYNYVAEWFLYLPMKVIGTSFLRYGIAMANVFLIPTNCLLAVFYLLLVEGKKKNSFLTITILCGVMFFGPNIYSLVQGYIGSSGLFFILFLMILVYLKKYEKTDILLAVITGITLILLLVIRRWFAYWIVSFFASIVLSYIIIKEKRTKLIPLCINLFIAGIIALSILVLVFNPLFNTITTYNYSEAYSVMKASGPVEIIQSFFITYGILYVVLMVLGLIKSFKKEEFTFALVALIQIILSIVLFNQVQRFGTHHYYIINIPCLMLIILGMHSLQDFCSKRGIILGLSAFNLLTFFNYQKTLLLNFDALKPVYRVSNALLSEPLPPLRFTEGIPEIQDMVYRLNYLAEETDYFYTIASYYLFNDDILRNALLPNNLEGLRNLVPSSVYDLRDYLPKDFFFYQYIIVSDPVMLQFSEDKQRVISILGDFMLNDERVSDYYKLVENIETTQDIRIKVFKRIELVPNSVRKDISDKFRGFYPNEPRMYEFSMLEE